MKRELKKYIETHNKKISVQKVQCSFSLGLQYLCLFLFGSPGNVLKTERRCQKQS